MRLFHALCVLGSVAFIFWPWAMAIGTAIYWFFGLPPFFEWDPDRWGFAIVWPLGAITVWAFMLWIFSGVLEWF